MIVCILDKTKGEEKVASKADRLALCKEAALAGGRAIVNYRPRKETLKLGDAVGFHAIQTSADSKSQAAILQVLKRDPKARFITEEHVQDRYSRQRVIGSTDLESMTKLRVYIIDELDGTSAYKIGHHEWSISVGCVERLRHIAGAIFAPRIYGGTLFYASLGRGTYVADGKRKRIQVANRDLKDAYILMGVDCSIKDKYPLHYALLGILGNKARTTNACGSCALGLGLVASGRADALIQPIQSPWDWAAGKVIIEEAGGTMIFYEMEEGKITRMVRDLRPEHYNPDKRTVGFIAGNSRICNQINDILINIEFSIEIQKGGNERCQERFGSP